VRRGQTAVGQFLEKAETMKRRSVRRLARVGVALCVVALAFGVTGRLVWRPGVTESNVGRIREGMTLREVEVILGRKADGNGPLIGPRPEGAKEMLWWEEGNGWVAVWLDSERRVLDKDSARLREGGGPLEQVLSLFGFQATPGHTP
jgi:hypothetical protein